MVTTVTLPDEGQKNTATIARMLTQHSISSSSDAAQRNGGGRRLANSGNTTHTGLVEESNGLNTYNENPFGNNNNPVPSLLRSIRGHKLAGIHRLTSLMKETLVRKSDPPMMNSSSNISVPYEGEIIFSDEPSTHHPTMDPPGIDMSEPTSQDCGILIILMMIWALICPFPKILSCRLVLLQVLPIRMDLSRPLPKFLSHPLALL